MKQSVACGIAAVMDVTIFMLEARWAQLEKEKDDHVLEGWE